VSTVLSRRPIDVIQDAVLYCSKWTGLFRLSRYLTRQKLRILCYHGFALNDEVSFRPGLFITMPTFEQRLRTLRDAGYHVVTLERGLNSLDAQSMDRPLVVITIDDVFHNVAAIAVPALRRFGMPATGYVTSYYCVKQTPVFRLVVRYMFWKTQRRQLVLSDLDARLSGTVALEDPLTSSDVEHRIVEFGEALEGDEQRTVLARRLGVLLGVDYEAIVNARTFHVVSPAQVRELAQAGIDIQLHTHRHRLPEICGEAVREIQDNRAVLEPLVGTRLRHLCYPSGIWSPIVWPWLSDAGVASATTCDPGLNYRDTPRLALKRILDAENLPQIRFEAELAGFKPLLRDGVERVRQLFGRSGTDARHIERSM
jgi:peptidoglycan/xylan/chitin deacetylase (PgdA/CDA1 family)